MLEVPEARGESADTHDEPFLYNKHNESIFDDCRYFPGLKHDQESVVKFDVNNSDFINHATLRALIVQLTSPEVIDYNLICDFFLTYRTFTDSHTVLGLLLTRLIWALQYVNSAMPETEHIGKLVLLRTFVVFRHWVLNYFVDDFVSDHKLCDAFVFYMNQITTESNLVNSSMVFEHKIITDIKIHWLSQINEFYNASINVDSPQNIFAYSLPSVSDLANFKKLTKSNTEASIHTNPSFRRSAMLSLYDQKAHHKCLIYDDANSNDENPQFSINNLLSQHKSSRTSLNDKLCEYQSKNSRRKPLGPSNKPPSGKHNYMNITDSSVALKKTSNLNEDDADKENITSVGFSTNGNVKLPSSKVLGIVPSTPVKKMEYTLRDALATSPKARTNSHLTDSTDVDVGRRKSIKKLMDGFKKSFNSNPERPSLQSDASGSVTLMEDPATEEQLTQSAEAIGSRVDILSARIVDELEYLIRYYIAEQKDAITETDDISRTAIEFQAPDEFVEVEVEEDDRTAIVTKSFANESLDPQEAEVSMVFSDLNLEKIDNLFSKDEITLPEQEFGPIQFPVTPVKLKHSPPIDRNSLGGFSTTSSFRRVTSINWNDEGNLNLENSALIDESASDIGDELKHNSFKTERMIKTSTQYFDVSNDIPTRQNPFDLNSAGLSNSSISTPSDIDNYDDEIADLGIAMSPQSMKKTLTLQKINNDGFATMSVNKRLSMLSRTSSGSLLKRDSIKSYLSYDSAFSVASNHKADADDNSHLKKKHGFHNLRRLVRDDADGNEEDVGSDGRSNASGERMSGLPYQLKTTSISSQISKTSSLRKSVRVSTLCALTELPFNDYRDSTPSSARGTSNIDHSTKLSDLAESSVFSIGAKSTARENNRSTSDRTSSNSVAIPGISNYALKELAAIPDESFSSKNPIQFALDKLEGKSNEKLTQADSSDTERDVEDLKPAVSEEERQKGLEDLFVDDASTGSVRYIPISKDVSPDVSVDAPDHVNNTEEILDEINNAATEDAIGYSSDIEEELRKKPITPIKTRARLVLHPSNSTPTMNMLFMSVPNSESTSPFSLMNPKAVLDGYALTFENLAIEKVMLEASHVSFVLSYDSKCLAEHLTIIEKDMLQEIDWKELIELQWNKELTPVNSWLEIIVNENYYNKNKGVNLVIARFNLMVNWTISEILLTRTEEERIAIISRYIHVAHHCLAMQNFSTLMQLILALTSEKVAKLKSTWKNLPPGDILTLKNLEELTSPLKNFINIRLCTNLIKPSRGCIPFVGLYLSDLVFNAERPKFVKKPKQAASVKQNDSYEKSVTLGDSTLSTEGTSPEEDRLINFSRFRTSVHVVKSLSQCIEWSSNYRFPIDEELLRKCLYIKSLDEEEMNYCLEVNS